jgi:hypothetical protein
MRVVEWWFWALAGVGSAAVLLTAAVVLVVVRGARVAEQRATDAAENLVRMTDDLERRIYEVREEAARVEHRIEIVDEGRERAPTPPPDELEDADQPR